MEEGSTVLAVGQEGEPTRVNLPALRRLLVESTGPGRPWTRRALSLAATGGKNPDLVRDLLRGSIRRPSADALHGLLGSLGVATEAVAAASASPPTFLIDVIGEVAAGVFRPAPEWDEGDRYKIEVGAPPFEGAERFALRMVGASMDLTIPDGSELEVLRVPWNGVQPLPGDLVIVARHHHGMIETTCKRLAREDGVWMLKAESTKPQFREAIVLGNADAAVPVDDGIEIIGIVLSAQKRHFRPR